MHNFDIHTDIPSQPRALFGSNERINLIIVSVSMLMLESLVIVIQQLPGLFKIFVALVTFSLIAAVRVSVP